MRGDKHLPVPAELHRSTVVLTDQITESCLGEPDANPQLWCALEDPLKLLWGHVRGVRRPPGGRFYGWHVKKSGGGRVNRACE